MGSETRYPSMNNVLAKKENANTTVLTWTNGCMSAGVVTEDRCVHSKLLGARAETTTEVDMTVSRPSAADIEAAANHFGFHLDAGAQREYLAVVRHMLWS